MGQPTRSLNNDGNCWSFSKLVSWYKNSPDHPLHRSMKACLTRGAPRPQATNVPLLLFKHLQPTPTLQRNIHTECVCVENSTSSPRDWDNWYHKVSPPRFVCLFAHTRCVFLFPAYPPDIDPQRSDGWDSSCQRGVHETQGEELRYQRVSGESVKHNRQKSARATKGVQD